MPSQSINKIKQKRRGRCARTKMECKSVTLKKKKICKCSMKQDLNKCKKKIMDILNDTKFLYT